jgi:hypothetical protein
MQEWAAARRDQSLPRPLLWRASHDLRPEANVHVHTLPALYTAVLIGAAAAIAAPVSAETPDGTPLSLGDFVAPQDSAYSAQTSEGAVTFDVQPRWEDGTLFVDIEANTHSVPLESLDMAAHVRLVIGSDSLVPDRAGELDGHHGTTTIEFRLESRPAEFTIEIRDVPDVPLRTLTWPAGATPEPENDDPPLSPEDDR